MVALAPILTTDGVRPEERFDYWCDARARSLSEVSISVKPEERLYFHGKLSAAAIGDAVLAEMLGMPYRVGRSKSDIDRVATDSLLISHQVRGPGWLDTPKPHALRCRWHDCRPSFRHALSRGAKNVP